MLCLRGDYLLPVSQRYRAEITVDRIDCFVSGNEGWKIRIVLKHQLTKQHFVQKLRKQQVHKKRVHLFNTVATIIDGVQQYLNAKLFGFVLHSYAD